MDYKEEQDGELEALKAIYSDELTILSEDPCSFDIVIQASNEDTRDEQKIYVSAKLQFAYVDKYPDDPPLIEVTEPSEHMTEIRAKRLLSDLNEEAQNNTGMVMVFTLVSTALEKLSDIIQEVKREIEEEQNKAKLEQQRLDEIKYKGTPVTLENFLAWKIRFDQEMVASGKRKVKDLNKQKKLTGKQLFERDSTLNESDIQFMTETGVVVDESLFQDLDDLELDEDFDD